MDEHERYAHLVKIRSIVVSLIVLGTVGLILLRVWGQEPKALEPYFGETNLNLLGDFLAGVFAPLAFIGIAAAFYLQHMQLRMAIAENIKSEQRQLRQTELAENEARLNLASVQANYQLQLYDKRIAAYRKVREAATEFATKGSEHPEVPAILNEAVEEAEFLFDDELRDWIKAARELAFESVFLSKRIDNHIKNVNDGRRISPEAEQRQTRNLERQDECAKLLFEMFFKPNFRDRFEAYLKVPSSIAPVIRKID